MNTTKQDKSTHTRTTSQKKRRNRTKLSTLPHIITRNPSKSQHYTKSQNIARNAQNMITQNRTKHTSSQNITRKSSKYHQVQQKYTKSPNTARNPHNIKRKEKNTQNTKRLHKINSKSLEIATKRH